MSSLHADDAFLSYYQFSHDPFTPRVPGFKFYPAQRKSVLGQLHHLARYGQLLLLITGPKGSGKTLLRQALVASTNKQAVQSLVLSGREATTRAGVLGQIVRGLEASALTADSILARAGQLSLTGQEVYLLVDDAGLLEDEALQTLFLLAAGNGEGRLHVFLFAEAELGARLKNTFELEEGFHCTELQPYTDAETREYLAQRLEGAGQSLDLLTEEQLEDIHVRSGGWPGAINQIAREAMVDSMLAQRDEMNTRSFALHLPRKHMLALLVACVAVAAIWLMTSGKSTITPQNPQAVGSDQSGEANPASGFSVEFSNANSPPQQPAKPVIREPLAMASSEAEADESVEVPQSQASSTETVQAAVVTVPLPLPVQSATTSTPVVHGQAENGADEVGQNSSALTPVVNPTISAESKASMAQAQPSKSAAKPDVTQDSRREPLAVSSPAASAWYQSQSPSRVSLQVLGTRSEANAKAFVKQYGADYRYYAKMHQGAPLYVVTYGVFSSRAAAEAARKTLPVKVQAGKPWPRTFASIQQEISNRQ